MIAALLRGMIKETLSALQIGGLYKFVVIPFIVGFSISFYYCCMLAYPVECHLVVQTGNNGESA